MKMSFSAVSQMIARKMREDPAYRAEMESSGRPVLETARERSSEELARILTPHTGPLDAETFRRLCRRFPSAEEMASSLLQDRGSLEASEEDWVWLALTVLWERWAPDVPSLESLDERMQLGYDEGGDAASSEIWLGVWRDVLHFIDELDLKSLDAFDERFGATQSLFNWVQDLEMELGNAMVRDERFIAERIRFCQEFLDRFPQEDPKIVGNMRSALAGSHIAAGRTETGDRLYREWLEADPAWGWGWIGWSDAYGPFAWGTHDFARAEEILRRGLEVPDLRDRKDVLERLADLYGEMGREEEESRVRRELGQLSGPRECLSVEGLPPHGLRIRRVIDFGAEGPPLEQLPELRAALARRPAPASRAKVGRNQPCPCGSGKKYKKCCGRSEAAP